MSLFWSVILIIVIAFTLGGVMVYFFPPIGDGETYIDSNPNNEPMVRIHYGWDVGTTVVVVPTSEIENYVKDFEILSIEPYIKK